MTKPQEKQFNERITIWGYKGTKLIAAYGETTYEDWCKREAVRIQESGQPCEVIYHGDGKCCVREVGGEVPNYHRYHDMDGKPLP